MKSRIVFIAGALATSLVGRTARSRAVPSGNEATRTSREVAADTVNAKAVLAAARGVTPIACSLIGRALENRWGGRQNVGGPDAAALDDAQAAAFEWAVSNGFTDDVLPLLRGSLADPDACVRRTAAELTGRIRLTDLAGALRSELASASVDTREAAVLSLGYSGERAAEPALATAARDAEQRVRRTAAWALGQTGDLNAVTPLTTLLRDADPLIRVNAALALGALSASRAIPALTDVLASDRDARVRRAAAAALGRIE